MQKENHVRHTKAAGFAATVRSLSAFALLLGAGPALAQNAVPAAPKADKSGFNLFNPTPRELMRELDTDRPDATEGAFTVDAGHLQIEFSFAEYTYDHHNADSQTVRSYGLLPVVLRIGLLNNTELDLGLNPYTRTRVTDRPTGDTQTADGFGDLVIGVKQNLWGNDGTDEAGDTAFAVIGSFKLPTAPDRLGNGKVEGSLGAALAMKLPAGFDSSVSATFEFVRNGANDGYVTDFTHSAVLGHAIVGDLSAYIEYTGSANLNHEERYRAYFDTGLTYKLTEDVQFDTGVRVGLTTAADDLTYLAGVSIRY